VEALAWLKTEDPFFAMYPSFSEPRNLCLNYCAAQIFEARSEIRKLEESSLENSEANHLSFIARGEYGKKKRRLMKKLKDAIREFGKFFHRGHSAKD
jgi:hypothetical protein